MASELTDRSGSTRTCAPKEGVDAHPFPITRTHLLLFIIGCCALHALLRWAVSETAGIDDVDQILRAQIWSWGYGPQPPLYTWLTRIFLDTFGYSVLSMLLLKELLILAIYGLVYAATRELTRSHLCALAATALLQANPSIAWEAHRELTHSVLASVCSIGTVYFFLRLTPDRWRSYVLFAACSGLGMLAKYNFAILWLALMLAALSVAPIRPLLFNRKMLVALLIGLAICAPHFIWVWQHQELAFSHLYKLKIAQSGKWLAVAAGLKKWVEVIFLDVGPMLGLLALLFWKGVTRLAVASPRDKLLWRTLFGILVLVTANIVWFSASGVRGRYAQPLFVWLPVLLVAALRDHLSDGRVKVLVALAAVGAIGIVLAAPGRVLLTEPLGKNEILNTPFRKLAERLKPEVDKADCLIAENHILGGNLRLHFPNKLVVAPAFGPLFPTASRTAVVVWDAAKRPVPPRDLLPFAQAFTGKQAFAELSPIEEVLKYHHQRTARLGVMVIR